MDAVDTISKVTREWGGDPDRAFGKSLKDYSEIQTNPIQSHLVFKSLFYQAREMQLRSRIPRPAYYKKANPLLYPELFEVVRDVAVAFEQEMPSAIYVTHFTPASQLFIMPLSKELFVPISFLNIADKKELMATIGHEMHHLRQPYWDKLISNVMLTLGGELAEWLKDRNILEGISIGKGMDHLLDGMTQRYTKRDRQYESEADQAGARLTSPPTVISALAKALAHTLDLPFDSIGSDQFVRYINRIEQRALKGASRNDRIQITAHSFQERVRRLQGEAKERAI